MERVTSDILACSRSLVLCEREGGKLNSGAFSSASMKTGERGGWTVWVVGQLRETGSWKLVATKRGTEE